MDSQQLMEQINTWIDAQEQSLAEKAELLRGVRIPIEERIDELQEEHWRREDDEWQRGLAASATED